MEISLDNLDYLTEKFFEYCRYVFMKLHLIEEDVSFINNLDAYEISLLNANLLFYEDFFNLTFPHVYMQIEEKIIFFLKDNDLIVEKTERLTDLIRQLTLSFFTASKSLIEYWQRILPPEKIQIPLCLDLLRSFGLYDKFFEELPLVLLRRFLASIVKLYKHKGTLKAAEYFFNTVAFKNVELIEMKAEKKSVVPQASPIFYGFLKNGLAIELPANEVADDRWWVSNVQFETHNLV